MIFNVGGELLTSTVSIVWRWKEYFNDILNPIKTNSEEEAELEDFGLGSPITGTEVAGVVKQLHSGSVPGGDETSATFRGTLDQLYTLPRVLEGAWEFAQPVHMCFVDL